MNPADLYSYPMILQLNYVYNAILLMHTTWLEQKTIGHQPEFMKEYPVRFVTILIVIVRKMPAICAIRICHAIVSWMCGI